MKNDFASESIGVCQTILIKDISPTVDHSYLNALINLSPQVTSINATMNHEIFGMKRHCDCLLIMNNDC